MDIKLLKTSILSNNIPKFLIFIENEPALSKQYITNISSTLNKAYKYYDSAENVTYDISTNMKEDFVYIIYNSKELLKEQSFIESLIRLNRNIILCYPEVDKNSAFYKQNAKYIVEFNKLDEYSLLAYAQKLCKQHKIAIEQDKLLEMVRLCDCQLGAILNELDKIFTLEQENSNVLMDYILKNGFPDYRKVNIYKLTDDILDGNKDCFSDYLKVDDSVVSIVYMLYGKARDRLLKTKNPKYGLFMKKCYEIYNGIIDGTLNPSYALKYFILFVAECA